MNTDIKEVSCHYPPGTKILKTRGTHIQNHEAEMRIKLNDKNEFLVWLHQHESLTNVTFRVLKTIPCKGTSVKFKAIYRCHHNTYPNSHKVKTPSLKHTNCAAKLWVTIKSSTAGRRVRSKDVYRAEYPAIIRTKHVHNHIVLGVEGLKFKNPTSDVKKKFLELFRSHHKPSKALEIHKQDLVEQYEDDYDTYVADRAICPDIKWIYRLYYSLFKNEINNGLNNITEEIINIIKDSKVKAKLKLIDSEFVLVVMPDLMERVHSLKSSSHIVYVDRSSNAERYRCQVFLFMTDSDVGGLPLGLLVTSSEREDIITLGLKLFKNMLPVYAFGGKLAPEHFLTDNSFIQNSIRNIFKNSKVWLSSFYILQVIWKWLWNSKNNVLIEDRFQLYKLFKDIVYSENYENMDNTIRNFLVNSTALKYRSFIDYAKNLLEKSYLWALNFRIQSKNGQTSIVDSSVNVLRDKMCNRTSSYNINQLFHYITNSLPEFYSNKIYDVINGKVNLLGTSKYLTNISRQKGLSLIYQKNDDIAQVKNFKTRAEYFVNIKLGLCTCLLGKEGRPCRHQYFVASELMQDERKNIYSDSTDNRDKYDWIAFGIQNSDENFMLLMKNKENVQPEYSNSFEVNFEQSSIKSENNEELLVVGDGNFEIIEVDEQQLNNYEQNFEIIDSNDNESITDCEDQFEVIKNREEVIDSSAHNFQVVAVDEEMADYSYNFTTAENNEEIVDCNHHFEIIKPNSLMVDYNGQFETIKDDEVMKNYKHHLEMIKVEPEDECKDEFEVIQIDDQLENSDNNFEVIEVNEQLENFQHHFGVVKTEDEKDQYEIFEVDNDFENCDQNFKVIEINEQIDKDQFSVLEVDTQMDNSDHNFKIIEIEQDNDNHKFKRTIINDEIDCSNHNFEVIEISNNPINFEIVEDNPLDINSDLIEENQEIIRNDSGCYVIEVENNQNVDNNSSNWEETNVYLKKVVKFLKNKFKNNPQGFSTAIKEFSRNFSSLKSESDVLASLHSFGRSNK